MKRWKGELTERSELQIRTTTRSGMNEPIDNWTTNVSPVNVMFWEISGKESDASGVLVAVQRVKGKMRYRKELDPRYSDKVPTKDFRIKRGHIVYTLAAPPKITDGGRFMTLQLTETTIDRVNG